MAYTTQDLLTGNPHKSLMRFALPYLIANFIQALYGGVDIIVIGWFTNAATLSAVSTGTTLMFMFTAIISGISVGGTILVGQYVGAKHHADASETANTMLSLYVGASLMLTALLFVLVDPILGLLKVPNEAYLSARQYVQICGAGIIFIFGYNGISAVLRGFGDSRSPVIFVAMASAVNIVLDLLFIGGLKWGAIGAALATLVAQGVSVLIAIHHVNSRVKYFSFKLRGVNLNREKLKRFLILGLPISFQDIVVHTSFMFITAIVNTLGVVPSAAIGICNKFESFAMLPSIAFSGAIAAAAAQSTGAGNYNRAKKFLVSGICMAFACSFIFFVWAQVAPATIMIMFSSDKAVIDAGVEYLKSFSYDFLLVAFGFVINSFINGCGHTTFSMVNGVAASLFIRLPLARFLVQMYPKSLTGLGAAAPIATAMSVSIAFIYLSTGKWRDTPMY